MDDHWQADVDSKFLSDVKYAFTLEAYANGKTAPLVVTKEVDIAVTGPFLLAKPDFSKTEVVKAYVDRSMENVCFVERGCVWKRTLNLLGHI
jgi:hypothetical protein